MRNGPLKLAPVLRDFLDGSRPDGQDAWLVADARDCSAVVLTYRRVETLVFEMHRGFEVGIVLSGKFERTAGSRPRRLRPGQVWLLPMWEPHGGRVVSPGTCVAVLFLPAFLGEERIGDISWLSFFALPPEERPQAATPGMRREAVHIAHDIAHEIMEHPVGCETALRLAVLQLLLILYRGWGKAREQSRRMLPSTGMLPRILPALELVQARPGVRLSLGEAAASCALSVSHFKRVFRQAMGTSFGQFSLRARLALVANQLVTTAQSEQLIAEETGFSDASHLHHSFLKHFGTTPGRYRQSRTP
jgi:AraC-like DNA-binding protein/quercetin dioxygenase-like cupin family protein